MSLQPERAEVVDGISMWIVGLGIVTVAVFPLSIPILVLTAVALLPLVIPALAIGLAAAVFVRWRAPRESAVTRREHAPSLFEEQTESR